MQSMTPPSKAAEDVSSSKRALYDEIAFDYVAIKSNVFKKYIEEPTFWKMLDRACGATGLRGKSVLDLACGNGYYSRMIKEKGAERVHGVDLSSLMIAEA